MICCCFYEHISFFFHIFYYSFTHLEYPRPSSIIEYDSTKNGKRERKQYFDNLFASFDRFSSSDSSFQNVECNSTMMSASSKFTHMMSMSFFSNCLFQFLGFDVITLSMTSVYLKKICEKSRVIKIKSIDFFELLFRMFTENTNNWMIHIDQAVVTSEGCDFLGNIDLFFRFHNHRIRFPIDEKYFYFKDSTYNLPKFYCKNKGIKIMKLVRQPFSIIIVSPFISTLYDVPWFWNRCYELYCKKYYEYNQERKVNPSKTYSAEICYDTIDCYVEFF